MNDGQTIGFHVNGDSHEVEVGRKTTLLQVLRDELHLTGTKKGCNVGDCGACTVLVDGEAMDSCLLLAAEMEGRAITTIEGLARDGQLTPLQRAFVNEGAIQCGFCTPGMIMRAVAFLSERLDPTDEEIARSIEGNLCRCTGYVKIQQAIRTAAKALAAADEGDAP